MPSLEQEEGMLPLTITTTSWLSIDKSIAYNKTDTWVGQTAPRLKIFLSNLIQIAHFYNPF